MQRIERKVKSLKNELESTQMRLSYAGAKVEGAQASLQHAQDVLQNELITPMNHTDRSFPTKAKSGSRKVSPVRRSGIQKIRRKSMEYIEIRKSVQFDLNEPSGQNATARLAHLLRPLTNP